MATTTSTTRLLTRSLTTSTSCRHAICLAVQWQRLSQLQQSRRSYHDRPPLWPTSRLRQRQNRRSYQTASSLPSKPPSGIAFAFDIDGVLLRSSAPLPGAAQALTFLEEEQIPYILLTNGGGRTEAARIADLNKKLGIDFLHERQIIQSHTPFTQLEALKKGTILVCGGEQNGVKRVAEHYGFEKVVSPGDLIVAYPELWPFNKPFKSYYESFAEPLPKPLYSPTGNPVLDPSKTLKIDAIFVYSDPREWGLDSSIILDLLLSKHGYLGTISEKNGHHPDMRNSGFLEDGQPHIHFSNPDLWWATSYHLSRLGQGGFQAALAGLWNRVTEGRASLDSHVTTIGKPSQGAYEFAERRLIENNNEKESGGKVRKVYMIGDNLESDIAGANGYQSPRGSEWKSILVKTGVWREGMAWKDHQKPHVIQENVLEAVRWAIEDARWG